MLRLIAHGVGVTLRVAAGGVAEVALVVDSLHFGELSEGHAGNTSPQIRQRTMSNPSLRQTGRWAGASSDPQRLQRMGSAGDRARRGPIDQDPDVVCCHRSASRRMKCALAIKMSRAATDSATASPGPSPPRTPAPDAHDSEPPRSATSMAGSKRPNGSNRHRKLRDSETYPDDRNESDSCIKAFLVDLQRNGDKSRGEHHEQQGQSTRAIAASRFLTHSDRSAGNVRMHEQQIQTGVG